MNPLAGLPPSVASNPSSLAERNLLRGWRLGLPSGQHVAHAMGHHALHDKDILIGKATGNAGEAVPINDPSLNLPSAFKHNCPLWTYILAEAMQQSGDREDSRHREHHDQDAASRPGRRPDCR